MSTPLLLAAAMATILFQGNAAAAEAVPAAREGIQPAFTPLAFGQVRPQGWILAQMKRDLATGFAGHLDELCPEASSDIFATGRNAPGKLNRGNAVGSSWWNGETEGNWRCGQLMLACLTQDPAALAKAKAYVDHVLANQDADGYIGIFAPGLRYQGNGELWTQTCLFRGLLAYADASGDRRVYEAVKRAVDRTVEGYAATPKIKFAQHDDMYTDVLETLHARTGDRKYLDFALRLHRECPGLLPFHQQPRRPQGGFQGCYNGGHGATVAESMRMPFWFWTATGDPAYLKMGGDLVAAMNAFSMPSGALVSQEGVNTWPLPSGVGYEYCTIFEREFSLIAAGQKRGGAADFEAAEHLFANAAQGSRLPDGSAILYCSMENRPSVHDEIGRRQRFSPTHQQVAVCCNPNASRIAAYFVASAWMRPAGAEPALAAVLYGPCRAEAEIAGVPVRITETTGYPYAGEIEIQVEPARPASFCLWLRQPAWAEAGTVACPGAEIRQQDGFWKVRKQWQAGDKVAIHFPRNIRRLPAVNGELALQYGPLLYVLPIQGEAKAIKSYANSKLQDFCVTRTAAAESDLFLPEGPQAEDFGFVPKAIAGTDPDYPLDAPATVLEGKLLGKDGAIRAVTLLPMGAKSTELRRVTFRVGIPPPPMTGGFEAEQGRRFGHAGAYRDPAASGGAAIGYLGAEGDGIECQSPLLAGQQLRIRYSVPTTTSMTLTVNGQPHQVVFPATGAWDGEGAYAELTVPVAIPEKAVVQLRRGPGDGPVNLDCLKGNSP